MKVLLIDVGNTKSKYAVYENKSISLIDRDTALNTITEFNEVICSSVSTDEDVDHLLCRFKGDTINVRTDASAFGIKNAYQNYQNLGIDRWLAVIGAQHSFPNQDLIVVDAGTAMTVDILTANKQHLGGWIIPGLNLMQSSIADLAPGVFTGERKELEVFGTDTPSALYSGCFFALTAAIEKATLLLEKLTSKRAAKILITGGDAKELAKGLEMESILIPDLVFKGLARFSKS